MSSAQPFPSAFRLAFLSVDGVRMWVATWSGRGVAVEAWLAFASSVVGGPREDEEIFEAWKLPDIT